MRFVSVFLTCAIVLSGDSIVSSAEQPQTTGTLFEPRNGRGYIPGWDDENTTSPDDLVHLTYRDFKRAHSRGGLVHVGYRQAAETDFIAVPEKTVSLVLRGRAEPVEGVFPRIRLSARTPESTGSVVLYEGRIQSLSFTDIRVPFPKQLLGEKVKLQLEVVNAGERTRERRFFLIRLFFRSV